MAFDFSKHVSVSKQIEVVDKVIENCMETVLEISLRQGIVAEDLTLDWAPEGGLQDGDIGAAALVLELKKLKMLQERRASLVI